MHGHVLAGGGASGRQHLGHSNELLNELDNCGAEKLKQILIDVTVAQTEERKGTYLRLLPAAPEGLGVGGGWAEKEERRHNMVSIDAV